MKIKLTQPISARRIAQIIHAYKVCIPSDAFITAIATHSSEVEKNTLFLSLRGERANGEAFLPEVLARGGFAVCETVHEGAITVSSVTDALFALAEEHLKSLCRLRHTVGITGSTGKTTTKELLYALVKDTFCTHATVGNQNSELGLPLTVLCAMEKTECLILEMGMNHLGEIERLSRLCKPSLAVITNVGHAHIGNLGSREKIAEAKKEILCGMKTGGRILIPEDEPLLSDIEGARTVGFGKGTYSVQQNADGDILLFQKNMQPIHFNRKMTDPGMLHAAAFSCAAALELGIDRDTVQKRILPFSSNVFRQKEFFIKNAQILFDAYNASFESVLCALEVLRHSPKKERALLLGDMLELGDQAEMLHRRLGEQIGEQKEEIGYLFLFGSACRFVMDGALHAGYPTERIFYNPCADRPEDSADAILPLLDRELQLTVKGARGMKMERILNILIKKTGGDDDAG